MKSRIAAVLLLALAVAAGGSGLALALRGNQVAASNNHQLQVLVLDVETLLLNGKTASAKAAHKTAVEVKLLLDQQAFLRAQVRRGTKAEKQAIRRIEVHLDRVIAADVAAAAWRQRTYGH